jgi:hypothetical protein
MGNPVLLDLYNQFVLNICCNGYENMPALNLF